MDFKNNLSKYTKYNAVVIFKVASVMKPRRYNLPRYILGMFKANKSADISDHQVMRLTSRSHSKRPSTHKEGVSIFGRILLANAMIPKTPRTH